MKRNRIKRILAAAVLGMMGISSAAYAQYVWLDEKGVKQYSDMPPPTSVPEKRILKEPGSRSPSLSSAPADASDAGTSAAPATKEKAPMTIAERNADFQKRRTEQAEKEKKAAEEARIAADKARHCDQARAYQRALLSGERLARSDKNGERYFLGDEERAKEARETKRALDECK
jgi:hypothetical protein